MTISFDDSEYHWFGSLVRPSIYAIDPGCISLPVHPQRHYWERQELSPTSIVGPEVS